MTFCCLGPEAAVEAVTASDSFKQLIAVIQLKNHARRQQALAKFTHP
jgi:hypothetical protein